MSATSDNQPANNTGKTLEEILKLKGSALTDAVTDMYHQLGAVTTECEAALRGEKDLHQRNSNNQAEGIAAERIALALQSLVGEELHRRDTLLAWLTAKDLNAEEGSYHLEFTYTSETYTVQCVPAGGKFAITDNTATRTLLELTLDTATGRLSPQDFLALALWVLAPMSDVDMPTELKRRLPGDVYSKFFNEQLGVSKKRSSSACPDCGLNHPDFSEILSAVSFDEVLRSFPGLGGLR